MTTSLGDSNALTEWRKVRVHLRPLVPTLDSPAQQILLSAEWSVALMSGSEEGDLMDKGAAAVSATFLLSIYSFLGALF